MYVCLVFILPGCHVSFGFCPCARDLTFAITLLRLLWLFVRLFFELLQWCRNLGHGSRNTICLPKPLEDGDAKLWSRWFDVYAAANEWNTAKKLVRLPTLLRGWVRAIYELLGEADNEPCATLKGAIISRLNLDTDKDCLAAHEQLSRRYYRERGESIDELVWDIKKLLDWSSPRLPAEVHDSELRFHLIVPCLKKLSSNWNLYPKKLMHKQLPRPGRSSWYIRGLRWPIWWVKSRKFKSSN